MAYKTCPDCGSRIFEHGCVNCNEVDYISMQQEYSPITITPPDKIPVAPPDELDKDAKVNGMDELKIYRFQALHIEDTFRIVANILKSRSKETCIDRQICKSIEMINGILNKR